MKALVTFLLMFMSYSKVWVSLDEKYLGELNDYLQAKVYREMLNTSLPSHSHSWQPDYKVDQQERSIKVSNVTVDSLALLASDFRVFPGKMVSDGKANYSCQAGYEYYDHLERRSGNMTVNTKSDTRVTIRAGRGNILTN